MIPTTTPLLSRVPILCAAALVTTALLSACAPAPAPTLTPTPAFSSEEEAFAAAEATYREFTSRLNKLDTTNPSTFEPLYDLSSGGFEAADREAYATMHANGVVVAGETKILSFEGTGSDSSYESVNATVCLDVSSVTVTDASGVSQVDPGRPSVYALDVHFVADDERLLIDSTAIDDESTC